MLCGQRAHNCFDTFGGILILGIHQNEVWILFLVYPIAGKTVFTAS